MCAKKIERISNRCTKVLPTVFDDSLSYYELLCKVTEIVNLVINNNAMMGNDVTALHEAYVKLQGYVNNYFGNLDLQNEINNKLDKMYNAGILTGLMEPYFSNLVEEINSLNGRVNTFTSLPDGSTTGDAELADGRVDYLGYTWSNIGEHIRNIGDYLNTLVGGLNVTKESENCLNENAVTYHNTIITRDGTLSTDDRGMRVYRLKFRAGDTVTIWVDNGWFYGIQSSKATVGDSGLIYGSYAETYFDTTTSSFPKAKTITLTHDYLYLCFLPKEPNDLLSVSTSKIMVSLGSDIKEYQPYSSGITINVANKKYEKDSPLSVYEQAYIDKCELVANEIKATEGDAVAQYTGVKMPSKVVSVKAKVKFYGNAFTTLIVEPNGLYSVDDVVNKSIHINMSKNICYIGYFDGRKLTNVKVVEYNAEEGVEYTVGFEYANATTFVVNYPTGYALLSDFNMYEDCAGCYAIWEHYVAGVSTNGFSCNHITKIYAKDDLGNVLCDDFKRVDGSIGVAPQGYVYSQFTSLNQSGWTL